MNDVPPILFCANHPGTPTSLRCNRCEKLICPKCSVLTPTGYRCKECVRGQQSIFDTAEWYDYILAVLIATPLAFLGSLIVPRLGFLTLLVAPVIGGIIGEIIRVVVRRRRSKRLFQTATLAAALGSAPYFLVALITTLLYGVNTHGILVVVWLGFYIFAISSTIYYRLSGISIR